MFNGTVRPSPELERIAALPRRPIDPLAAQDLAVRLTELLKTPGGTQTLRPAQALALYDIGTVGGLFAPLGVGEGKTLITLLAPYVLEAERPLLLLPASLAKKTVRERDQYAKHWRISSQLPVISYEMLGRVQAAEDLEHRLRPDVIIADEVHRLKNRRAAVTRRVYRYMHEHPETRFVGLSGTIMRKSLLDFGHILRWCLKTGAPVPKTETELEEWAMALDEKLSDELRRNEPGALLVFADQADKNEDDVVAARRGFRKRLLETPGVVATIGDGERVDCSIYIHALEYDLPPIANDHFDRLRNAMQTPDGWDLMQAVDVWRHARELALGFFYRWNPRPPDDWRNARRDWCAYVRDVLAYSRTLDSPEQVALAIDAGKLDDGGVLERWRAARDLLRDDGKIFKPNTEAVWYDDTALRVCAEWMKEPGIVWTEHALFAERLSELTGAKYYGAQGFSADGSFVDDADPKRAAILSIDANREGRNLQKMWFRNLFTSPMEGADAWQQAIGRTHRPGQMADQVLVEIFLGCLEHANAWRRAIASATAIRDTTGAASKILTADVTYPEPHEISALRGWRWGNDRTSKYRTN